MISTRAWVSECSVKSRDERCFSEIRLSRWPSMFSSEAIDVHIISCLHS